MFRIMLQKMWHKKWMSLSLLIGCVLLISTAISFPLYEKAAYDRMLQDEFNMVISQEGDWPTLMTMATYSQKDKSGMIGKVENLAYSMYDNLGLTENQTVFYYVLQRATMVSDMKREDAESLGVSLAGLTDIEDHITIANGECFSETGLSEDGCIEVIISEECMVSQGLLLGEKLTLKNLEDGDGNPIRIQVKGVFRKADEADFYWQDSGQLGNKAYMNMDLFRKMFTTDYASKYTINCQYYVFMNYEDIKYDAVQDIVDKTKYYCEESGFRSVIDEPGYMDTLDTYMRKINRISATLAILQVPVLIMVCAFLLMISGQMYEMERNEISVIKSRGSYRSQIFRLYLYQSMVLVGIAAILGIPLGVAFSKVLGATRNFLEFDASLSLEIVFTPKAAIYAVCAMLLALISLTVPAIKHSKISIVNLKQQKALKKKSWWEKLFIDFILIGISVYGYYNFHKNMSGLAASVLEGKSLDPLLYLSSSLFILGLGLLFLRIHPYIVMLIYNIGKRFWKSASYISFQENIRNGRKQQLIMLFLIITVSLGIYHATVARTILANAVENTEYLNGGEVVFREFWPLSHDPENKTGSSFMEPDFTKYMTMDIADSCTKVLYVDAGYLSLRKSDRQNVTIMGIHTKEFGSMTQMPEGLLDKSYYEYLNDMAVVSDGVLVSSNFNTLLGYEVGDSITFYRTTGMDATGTIVGFVDYFPGYAPTVMAMNPDGTATKQDNFLIVAHYEVLRQRWGTQPYEIWIDLKDGYGSADMLDWIEENEIQAVKYSNKDVNLQNTMEDPLLQGTNGVLTMGFIVIILLCAIGYLIYWIMAIRERELMFGVLRACGFHKGELVHMLINEQIFCGVFSVLAGIGIGKLSSEMFVPILQQAYASENQVLPMKLITDAADMYRLYGVISGAMLVALLVLVIILFKMNVTKALKLGEE
ncbi:MAG: ABC transporter permease [Lachnospiraceae bacterium]|nr:ABC transporter permease [Lachnospiraceae bacterium]